MSAAINDASIVAMNRLWSKWDRIVTDKAGVAGRMSDATANEDQYEISVGRGITADTVRGRIDLVQKILFR